MNDLSVGGRCNVASVSDCSTLYHKGVSHRCFCCVQRGECIFQQPVSHMLSLSVLFSVTAGCTVSHVASLFYMLFSCLCPLSTECKHRMKGFDCLNPPLSILFPRIQSIFILQLRAVQSTPDLILKLRVNGWFFH